MLQARHVVPLRSVGYVWLSHCILRSVDYVDAFLQTSERRVALYIALHEVATEVVNVYKLGYCGVCHGAPDAEWLHHIIIIGGEQCIDRDKRSLRLHGDDAIGIL